MIDLSGSRVLVMGASSGLGRAVGRRLTDLGATVAFAAVFLAFAAPGVIQRGERSTLFTFVSAPSGKREMP